MQQNGERGTRAPRRSARARKLVVKAGAGRRSVRRGKRGDGFFGNFDSRALGGSLIGKFAGNADKGRSIGSAIGGFLPF
jgi:hypothetical protein